MRIQIRRDPARRWYRRVMILQESWRIDWRTPAWLPLQVVVTLRRWIE